MDEWISGSTELSRGAGVSKSRVAASLADLEVSIIIISVIGGWRRILCNWRVRGRWSMFTGYLSGTSFIVVA